MENHMVCARKTASQAALRIPINRITYSVQMCWQEKSHPESKDYILIWPMICDGSTAVFQLFWE